jgi:two-component system invasion response regulator UvrY
VRDSPVVPDRPRLSRVAPSGASGQISVFIADDHPAIGLALSHGLQAHHMAVVGRATVAENVVDQVRALDPHVVVLDVRFGRDTVDTGLDVARQLLREAPRRGIVAYSQFDTVEIIQEAYRTGIHAFVPKSAPLDLMATAIEHARAGRVYFVPDVADRLARVNIAGDRSPQAVLEPRELEVFRYIAIGLTSNEIAEEMNLSPKTVSNARQAVLEKLKADRQADITLLAVAHGLISPVPFAHARLPPG